MSHLTGYPSATNCDAAQFTSENLPATVPLAFAIYPVNLEVVTHQRGNINHVMKYFQRDAFEASSRLNVSSRITFI